MTPTLFPYQELGRDFLASQTRCGLFDDPGLGKTAQTVSALDKLGLERGWIVCPASARSVWRNEIKKFSDRPRRVITGLKNDDLNLWLRGKADVLLLSYEKATSWKKELTRDLVEFCVFDEAHYLKNAQAQRTRAALSHQCDGAFGYARWAAHVWFLTGTPMANDPSDIWTWLRFCHATTLSLRHFTDRYFVAKMGSFNASYTPRKETVPELKKLIEAFSLRRRLKDAGLNLPPLWITTQTIEGDTREINALIAQHPGLDTALIDAVNKGGLSFLEAAHSTTLRRLVGEAKAPVFAQQLIEELNGGLDKVVVMCAHTRPVEVLIDVLNHHKLGWVRIDGTVAEKDRGPAVARFQTDPDCRVFLGNIKAAGTALTLTAASQLVMLESSWVPADNAQAIKRVHRIGQGSHVHVRFISLAKSIDETVAESVARKTASIAMVEGD